MILKAFAVEPLRGERREFPKRLPLGLAHGHVQWLCRIASPNNRAPLDNFFAFTEHEAPALRRGVELDPAGVTIDLRRSDADGVLERDGFARKQTDNPSSA